jgi:hypothetical protein
MERVGFTEAFASVGLSPEKANVAKCLVAARMLRPASERSTFDWLTKGGRRLGDLAGLNFHLRSVMELYRVSDILLNHKDILINSPVLVNNSLLDLTPRRLLYDITNTYFEGNPKSDLIKRGRSKEKRADRPLLSFGLISDNESYVNTFKFYPGNVSESTTLQDIVIESKIDFNTIISMDRGIAIEANIKWLDESGYLYLVGSRERNRTFDPDKITQRITSKTGNKIALYIDEASDPKKQLPGEIRVRCFSESQHAKDKNIISARRQGYEKGLRKLNDRCANPLKKLSHSYVMRRIGALDAKYMVSSHYKVNVTRADMGDPDGMTRPGSPSSTSP